MPAETPPGRQLPSPLVAPLDDNRRVMEMISQVTRESLDDVRLQLMCEERDLACHHREDVRLAGLTPHVWDDRLERFYRESRAWLPAHVAWNRRPEKLSMREWIGRSLSGRDADSLRILVVGDGSGFDSLYLSLCGHDVTYWELSEPCVAFARRLFATSGRQVHVVAQGADPDAASFDVVVCLDVLEHHPDPPSFVGQLAGYLRPGGRLIVHAPFFFVTRHNPTHLRSNRKYSGDLARLYLPHGLRLADGRFFWNPIVLRKHPSNGVRGNAGWLRIMILRFSGILLAIGRFWSFPHNLVAIRAFRRADPRWLSELEGAPGGTLPVDSST